ncbi:MAG: DUF2177 family protein [Candidatus Moranbacteria bacterium]|nr:DUF2177 family protein [Candidatus Moranbacteria bacterium]
MFWKLYLIALPVFFAIDMLWLGIVARNFYRNQVGALLKTDFNWVAGVSFYLLFIAGLVFFVIEPAVKSGNWTSALLVGALFGLMTYATYDLTNLATLKDWTLTITLVDMAWGMVLAASVSTVTYLIAEKLHL